MDTKATVLGLSWVMLNRALAWTCFMQLVLDGTLALSHESDCNCEGTFRPRPIPVHEKEKPIQSNGTVDWNRPETIVRSPSNERKG